MSDELLEQHDAEDERDDEHDDSAPIKQIRDQLKAEQRARREMEQENARLREQAEEMAPVREIATEHLATNTLGLDRRRARAAARLHDGPITADGLRETIERYHLDRPVGGASEGGEDG